MTNKNISFNLDNPEEKKLYDQIKNVKNFSAYAKSLIKKDVNDTMKINLRN